jgi:hypothetical protein
VDAGTEPEPDVVPEPGVEPVEPELVPVDPEDVAPYFRSACIYLGSGKKLVPLRHLRLHWRILTTDWGGPSC